MIYDLRLQDPTNPATIYLFEAVIEAMDGASEGRGLFAFASRDGVNSLLLDDAVTTFLGHGSFDLMVGIDAVTNRPTLERLQELEGDYPSLQVRVFWNRTSGLFHPKLAHFAKDDGSHTLIVGSGNLTPGGLRDNFEAYSVLQAEPGESIDFSSWDNFLARHDANIRPIDEEALERAARNIIRGGRGGRRRRDVEPDVVTEGEEAPTEEEEALPVPVADRILVAQLPKAGGDYGRWSQAHFNKDIIDQFFHAQPDSTQRVYLTARRLDGSIMPQEVRRVIYSHSNKNMKIELGARKGEAYPAAGPPVAVFREIQARTFQYMILMPSETGYRQMFRLTQNLPSVGRGLPRVLTDVATVRTAWPGCPLV
jgi:hypothetical protein